MRREISGCAVSSPMMPSILKMSRVCEDGAELLNMNEMCPCR